MEPYDEQRGVQVRADGKVIKPFDPHALISAVEQFAAEYAAPAGSDTGATQVLPSPMAGLQLASEFNLADTGEWTPSHVQPLPDFPSASEPVPFSDFAKEAEETPDYSAALRPSQVQTPIGAPPTGIELEPDAKSTPEFLTFEQEVAAPAAPLNSMDFEEPTGPPPHDEPMNSFRAAAAGAAVETPLVFSLPQVGASEPQPIFTEDQIAPPVERSSTGDPIGTLIFRSPVELADPVWRDEIVPASPDAEPTPALGPDPPIAAASPAAPAETTGEFWLEPEVTAPPMAATNLDSFSLDDATAGQVRFVSPEPEAAFLEGAGVDAAPVEIAPINTAPPDFDPPLPVETPVESSAEVAPPLEAPTEAPARALAETAPSETAPAQAAEAQASPETETLGQDQTSTEAEARADVQSAPEPQAVDAFQGWLETETAAEVEAAHDSQTPGQIQASPVAEILTEDQVWTEAQAPAEAGSLRRNPSPGRGRNCARSSKPG